MTFPRKGSPHYLAAIAHQQQHGGSFRDACAVTRSIISASASSTTVAPASTTARKSHKKHAVAKPVESVVKSSKKKKKTRNSIPMEAHSEPTTSIATVAASASVSTSAIKPPTPIRFVTYNLLVADPWYEDDVKGSIVPKYRHWHDASGIRKRLLKAAVQDTDVMALVEVTPEMMAYVTPATHLYVYANRPGEELGSAIVYDATRFELMASVCIRLNAQAVQIATNVLLRDRTCSGSNKVLCVTALHLKSGYADMELRRQREIQVAVAKTNAWLVKQAALHQWQLGSIAHVVAGDLNSDRLAYKSLVQAYMLEQGFTDAFGDYKESNYWTYNYWHKSIFDYVFVTGNTLSVSDRFVPVSTQPSPNEKQGSDHLPMYCNLLLQ